MVLAWCGEMGKGVGERVRVKGFGCGVSTLGDCVGWWMICGWR